MNSLKHTGTTAALTRINREAYYSKYFEENKKDTKRIQGIIKTNGECSTYE